MNNDNQNTMMENNIIENHLYQMNVIRLALKGPEEEEIARVEDERNQDHYQDNLV